MKILGWMHRKFRQNSIEAHKDLPIGLSGHQTLEDFQCFPKGSSHFNNKPFSKSQRERGYLRNSFADLEAARFEFEQEQSSDVAQLFHGFLAIGTLGNEPIASNEPATPTFQISAVDHIAEKETEVTEVELKLINDELEKVLGGAEEVSFSNPSSARNSHVSVGRNSHVSVGRISHCSAITLSDQKVIESGEIHGNESAVICPLQNYLLGSAAGITEMPRTMTKKEKRTSLEELFQKTKQAEENYYGIKAGKKIDKEITDKSAVHLMMKKMLKRSNMTKNSGGTTSEYSAMAEKKLRKIRKIFSRKVHPENIEYSHDQLQPTKNEIKNDGVHVASYDNGGGLRPSSEDDIIIYPERGLISNNHQRSGGEVSNGNWVKSDADYLVLEL